MDAKRISDHFGRFPFSLLAELSQKTGNEMKFLKKLAVKLFHTQFSSNMDSDLNENSGGFH